MKHSVYSVILILSYLGLSAQNPGDLNTDFAAGGFFIEYWDDTISRAFDIGVSSEGNLILPGFYESVGSEDNQIFVMSLDSLGNILPFGNSDRGLSHDISTGEYATKVVMLPDDKMLVAGNYTQDINYRPFVIRLNSDGSKDENFADNGVLMMSGIPMRVTDAEVFYDEGSYKIILSGESYDFRPILIMINEDGMMESSFGTLGVMFYYTFLGYFTDIIIDNEKDKLYAGMVSYADEALLLKYSLPAGTPDTLFGIGGMLSSESLAELEIRFDALIFDKQNDLLTAFGTYTHPDGDLDICAFRANASDGSTDQSFGLNGWAWLRSAGSDERILNAIQQSDGKYYIGGYTDYLGTDDFMVGRLKFNGALDNTFGTGGLVVTEDIMGMVSPDSFHEKIQGLALSPLENTLYAAGFSFSGDWQAIMVIAYHTGYIMEEHPVGLTEDRSLPVTVYPNPAVDRITVKTEQQGIHRIRIRDITGRILLERYCPGESIDLSLEGMLPSIYLIEVTLPGLQVITEKIIKQ